MDGPTRTPGSRLSNQRPLPARDIDLRDLRLFFAISFAGLHIGKWPALPTVSSRYSDLIAAIGSIATARPARR
jgi:hypothetical protein